MKREQNTTPEVKSPVWMLSVSMMLTQLLFILITVMLMYGTNLFLDSRPASIVGSLVGLVLLIIMYYKEAWRKGKRDQNSVRFGHIPDDRRKGAKAAFLQQSVGLLLAVWCILFTLVGGLSSVGVTLYRAFYIPFLPVLEPLVNLSAFFYLLPVPVMVLTGHIGYRMGFKGFVI